MGTDLARSGAWLPLLLLGACAERPAPVEVADGGGDAAAIASAALASSPADAPPQGLDVASIMRRVHFAFRAEGEEFTGGHGTYGVKVGPQGRVELTPCRRGAEVAGAPPPQVERGAPLTLETVAVERGGAALAAGEARGRVEGDGSLSIARGAVVEHLHNGDDGVEQSWSFAAPPPGEGDLTVRVRPTGQGYAGRTEKGHHFVDPATGLGFRYGLATWIDASGARTGVDVQRAPGGDLVLTVPHDVLAASSFPAVLDPTIGPELGLDAPILAAPPGNQFAADVAFDGSNFLVVWLDPRTTNAVIMATRVTRTGEVLDPGGIVVNRADEQTLHGPRVVFGGPDFLVAWGGVEGNDVAIRGARVSTTGAVLDATSAVLLLGAYQPALAFDGENYLAVGTELDADGGVFAARVTRGGVVLDDPPVLVASQGHQPAVAFGGGNYLVVWTDQRNGIEDIYGNLVSPAGTLVNPNGIPIHTSDDVSFQPAVAFDGSQHLVVFRERHGTSGPTSDILGRRVTTVGGAGDPITIAAADGHRFSPAVAFGGAHFLVVWSDERSGDQDLRGARVDRDGLVNPNDATAGVVISAFPGGQPDRAALAFDGTNFLVVWDEDRNVNSPPPSSLRDTFAARVSQSMTVLDPLGVLLSTVVTNAQTDAAVAHDGTDYLIVWSDTRGPSKTIVGVRVSRTGAVRDPSGLVLGSLGALSDQARPAAAWNGSRYLVVWEGYASGSASFDVEGALVAPDGTGAGVTISDGPGDQVAPRVAFGGGSFLVVWQDLRGGATYDVFGARVSGAGAVLDPAGIAISAASGDQVEPVVAYGSSSFLVAWSDSRAGSADIFAARVSKNGGLLDGPASSGGIVVSGAPGNQSRPAIAFNGSGYFVVWEDRRAGAGDIYGTPVNTNGAVGAPTGRRISGAAGDQTRPAIAYHGKGYLVVWEDRRAGGAAALYGARLTKQGALMDEEGFLVASGDTEHRAPALSARSGQALCAFHRLVPSFAAIRARARLITP
ncbi:MAG: hypothetical protein M9894_25560 [Planctomycetes bacterium]|nr:hypothetical protein [Planctomycetota bacterium]